MNQARDRFPDILRGFALLGIAMVNVQYFSVDTVSGFEAADLTASANSAAAFIVMLVFQSKFYLLFSFLFGYSAHYVIKGDVANKRRWVGRSAGLLILGLLHAIFLFHGDILVLYGAFAFILLGLYFKQEKTIRRWAKGIYIFIGVVFSLLAILTYFGEAFLAAKGKTLPTETEGLDGLNVALASGSFFEAAAARFELWLAFALDGAILQGPLVMVAFLVGILVARREGLAKGADPEAHEAHGCLGIRHRPSAATGCSCALYRQSSSRNLQSWTVACVTRDQLPNRSYSLGRLCWRSLANKSEVRWQWAARGRGTAFTDYLSFPIGGVLSLILSLGLWSVCTTRCVGRGTDRTGNLGSLKRTCLAKPEVL